jgi:hypothetical protein
MESEDQRVIQRLRYTQRQLLRSQDFATQQAVEVQLRAWHNRAIHRAYGVAPGVLEGLRVAECEQHGRVCVEAGIAYDAFGRELILQGRQMLAWPKLQEPALLILRSKLGSGACGLGIDALGAARPVELVWIAERRFSVRDGVALARASEAKLTPFQLLEVRPLARPRMASGSTIPGATLWEAWDGLLPNAQFGLESLTALQVPIDTSTAGFATVPLYFAELEVPLFFRDAKTGDSFMCVHHDQLEQDASDSFTFRTLLALVRVDEHDSFARAATLQPAPVAREDIRRLLREQRVCVSWWGVELERGTPGGDLANLRGAH